MIRRPFRPHHARLLLLLPIAALGIAGCSPSSTGNGATGNSASTGTAENNSAQNNASNSAIISSTPSSGVPTSAALLQVWVPGSDDKLHLHAVSKAALDTQKKFKDPTEAFNEIIRLAPKYFPPKTRVTDWHDDGKSVSLNFNRAFTDAGFWSKRGEGRTELAVYAMVNSAATSAKTPRTVVLQVEKRPITSLGEMDTSDAIEPNTKLQSSGGDASNSASPSPISTSEPGAP